MRSKHEHENEENIVVDWVIHLNQLQFMILIQVDLNCDDKKIYDGDFNNNT